MRPHDSMTLPEEYIASPSSSLGLKTAVMVAKIFRLWIRPRPNAATAGEEFSFIDNVYLKYKFTRPITKAEDGVSEAMFACPQSAVRLPDGFRKETFVTIGAAGDLMPAAGLEYSKDVLYESIADTIFDADISLANLEAPTSSRRVNESEHLGNGVSIWRMPREQFHASAQHQGKYFTALSFANNHALDMGIEGINATQKMLDANGIVAIGISRAREEYRRARIITENGVKIGFVSATFALNGLQVPKGESYRINTADLCSKYSKPNLELLDDQIQDCKSQACDFIVASVHWGWEYEFFPRLSQVEAAHELVERGVDLILGHHPHVIQPVEYYRTRRDPNRLAVIAYSLGGVGIWEWHTAPHLVLGLIIHLQLAKGHINGESITYIEGADPIPIFQTIVYRDGIRVKRMERLSVGLDQPAAGRSGRKMRKIREYARLVLGNRFT